ncbi:hypothetical protein JD491_05985 [Aeromonas caviae]|uniref:hypothetical protein n=1 Tax=Aeromonas caviae TaxID=648 RepID=UPI0019231C9E|nr:hypothetical protein [Aeromonas caviae]MBL0577177.1 hypothetical protein [Aeromonas caviae]
MSYDQENCPTCPYYEQKHLDTTSKTDRKYPPVTLENNKSEVLLVFQAPGIDEWHVGKAIQPVKKKGGSAGARIEQSWSRCQKHRNDFDIINVVQCFPGTISNSTSTRDLPPNSISICKCKSRLLTAITAKKYSQIIVFGKVAHETVNCLFQYINYKPVITYATHPTGGVSRQLLDELWVDN